MVRRKRQVLSRMLVLCLLWGLLPATAWGAQGEEPSQGSGEESSQAQEELLSAAAAEERVPAPPGLAQLQEKLSREQPGAEQDPERLVQERLERELARFFPPGLEEAEAPRTTGETVELFAAGSGFCGRSVSWKLEGNTLTLSGSGAMYSYALGDDHWGAYASEIQELVVESGVTGIGSYAFARLPNLRTVTVRGALTQVGEGAFAQCAVLQRASFQGVLNQIDLFAFYECTALEEVALPAVQYSGLQIGEQVFRGCSALRQVAVPGGDSLPYYVSALGQAAFFDCTSLERLEIPYGITTIEYGLAFNCVNLRRVGIPGSVTSVAEFAFCLCESLADVYFSGSPGEWEQIQMGADNEILQLIRVHCEDGTVVQGEVGGTCGEHVSWRLSLGVLTISGTGAMEDYLWDLEEELTTAPWYDYRDYVLRVVLEEGVTTLGRFALAFCPQAEELYLPASLAAIHDAAVYDCVSLRRVYYAGTLDAWNTAVTVESGNGYITRVSATATADGAILGCCGDQWENVQWILQDGCLLLRGTGATQDYQVDGLRSPWSSYAQEIDAIRVEQGVTGIGDVAFLACTALERVELAASVEALGYGVFFGCTALRNVTLPERIVSIPYACFSECSCLEEVSCQGPLTRLEESCFSECSRLRAVRDRSGNSLPETLEAIEKTAFYGCASLREVQLTQGLRELGGGAFYSCTGLRSITLPGGLGTVSAGAFSTCTGLEQLTIQEGIESLDTIAFSYCVNLKQVQLPESLREIGKEAFLECSMLTELPMAGHVEKIGDSAFGYCVRLARAELPAHVTELGGYLFQKCSSLRSVSIASATSLSEGMFLDCTSLSQVELPEGLEVLGKGAFYGCTALTSLRIPSTVKRLERLAFFHCESLAGLQLPETLTTIPDHSFAYSGLAALRIPEGVGSIEDSAFLSCTQLTALALPAGLSPLPASAFRDCEALEDLFYGGGDADWQVLIQNQEEEEGLRAPELRVHTGCLSRGRWVGTFVVEAGGTRSFQGILGAGEEDAVLVLARDRGERQQQATACPLAGAPRDQAFRIPLTGWQTGDRLRVFTLDGQWRPLEAPTVL